MELPRNRLSGDACAQERDPLNRPPLSRTRHANRSTEPEPLRHVIDEYKHKDQTITCVCGWHGSSATNATGGSDWTTHLNQFRTKRK